MNKTRGRKMEAVATNGANDKTVRSWIDLALTRLTGLVVVLAIGIFGWAFTSTNGRIDKIEAMTAAKVEKIEEVTATRLERVASEAAARSERITALDVSLKGAVDLLIELKADLKDIKAELREIRNRK